MSKVKELIKQELQAGHIWFKEKEIYYTLDLEYEYEYEDDETFCFVVVNKTADIKSCITLVSSINYIDAIERDKWDHHRFLISTKNPNHILMWERNHAKKD